MVEGRGDEMIMATNFHMQLDTVNYEERCIALSNDPVNTIDDMTYSISMNYSSNSCKATNYEEET